MSGVLRVCSHPGCNEVQETNHCAKHPKLLRIDYRTKSATARGYDYNWRKFREFFLQQPGNQICRDCQRAEAKEVHHIQRVADFPQLKLVATNCMGLCKSCHSIRTKRGE